MERRATPRVSQKLRAPDIRVLLSGEELIDRVADFLIHRLVCGGFERIHRSSFGFSSGRFSFGRSRSGGVSSGLRRRSTGCCCIGFRLLRPCGSCSRIGFRLLRRCGGCSRSGGRRQTSIIRSCRSGSGGIGSRSGGSVCFGLRCCCIGCCRISFGLRSRCSGCSCSSICLCCRCSGRCRGCICSGSLGRGIRITVGSNSSNAGIRRGIGKRLCRGVGGIQGAKLGCNAAIRNLFSFFGFFGFFGFGRTRLFTL